MLVTEAKNVDVMILTVVTWPPIHNMMVVTSPIGDHAPPALAAIITKPPNNHTLSFFLMILRSNALIIMAVVMLSNPEERKKVIQDMIHNNLTLFDVVIRSVMTLNPS